MSDQKVGKKVAQDQPMMLKRIAEAAQPALADEDLMLVTHNHLVARDEIKRNPVTIMMLLREVYGYGEGNDMFTATFPRVGSAQNEVNADGTPMHTLFDTYWYMGKGTKGDKLIRARWYHEYCDTLPDGKEIRAKLDAIKNKTGEYATASNDRIDTDTSKYTGRLNGLRKLYKDALNVHFQWVDIEAMNPQVMVKIATVMQHTGNNEDGTPIYTEVPADVPDCLLVYHKDDRFKYRVMNVTEFLSLDVTVAKTKGGTYEALLASGQKAPTQAGEKKAEGTVLPPITDSNLWDYFDKLADLFPADDAEELTKSGAKLWRGTNDKELGEQRIYQLGNIFQSLDSWWSQGGDKLYHAVQQRMAAQEAKEKEEKVAASAGK